MIIDQSSWIEFFDKSPNMIVWTNEEGGILLCNKAFKRRMCLDGKTLSKLKIDDFDERLKKEQLQNFIRTNKNEVFSYKTSIKTAKNEMLLVEAQIHTYFSPKDQSRLCSFTFTDVKESSFYKKLLKQTESFAKVGGWKLDLRDGSIIATEQAKYILGVSTNDSLLPGKITEIFEEKELLKNHLVQILRKGTSYDCVLSLRSNKRIKKYIRCISEAEIENDRVISINGIYQDVTGERLKQKQLSTFKYIIDNTKDMVYFRDQNYNLKYCNNAALTFTGWKKDEIASKSLLELFPKFNREDGDNLWKDLQYNRVIDFKYDHEIRGKQVNWNATSFKISHQNEKLICLIVNDTTKLVAKEIELRNALEEISKLKDELEIENENLKLEINKDHLRNEGIVFKSKKYQKLLTMAMNVAKTNTNVLVTGESGTGKELIVRHIHANSLRKNEALIKVNMAALPESLIESELFGHKKGAFTGAMKDKYGKFSLADKGTIFLDEIGEMPIHLQSKLLRVLQEGEIDMLGSQETTKVDVRVIAATNRDLKQLVNQGKFREDLYYRLNVFPIHNIPLRERKEDIPSLIIHFIEKFGKKIGKKFNVIEQEVFQKLIKYDFPGNIRELENLIERAVIMENPPKLKCGSWLPVIQEGKNNLADKKLTLETIQRDHIIKILDQCNWKVSGPFGAANILEVNSKTLHSKMKKLGIEKEIVLRR